MSLSLVPPGIGPGLGSGPGIAWSIHEIIRRIGGFVDLVPKLPEPVPATPQAASAVNLAKSSVSRWRRLAQALGKQLTDTFLDLIGESVKDAVLFPGATLMLSDALAFWVYSDLLTKSTYDAALNIPTAETFANALNYILDTVAALLATDIISNRDVGSDIAESVIDGFAGSVVGDVIKGYLDTVAGINPVDDDEIRDIIGDGALGTPEELAYVGARSGLDTFSAMSEVYTGLLQGDNPYWNRAVKEVEEILKRFERGLSGDVYLSGTLVERMGTDVVDSVYWYLEALDGILNRLKNLTKDVVEAHALYKKGVLDTAALEGVMADVKAEIDAVNELLDVFSDPFFINELVDTVVSGYDGLTQNIDFTVLKNKLEAVLGDVAKRMAEYVETVKEAYRKLNEIRKVEVEKT
jgi:hypothetical protein